MNVSFYPMISFLDVGHGRRVEVSQLLCEEA